MGTPERPVGSAEPGATDGKPRDGVVSIPTVNGHDVYLLRAFLVHAVLGYAVVRGITRFPPAAAAVGALVPDVDLYLGPLLGLPVVHRGVLHTPAALLVLAGAVLFAGGLVSEAPKRAAIAFGMGYLSHLVVDSFTAAGIMWLYPATAVRVSLGVPIHGAGGTAVLLGTSLAFVLLGPEFGLRGRHGDPRTTGGRERLRK